MEEEIKVVGKSADAVAEAAKTAGKLIDAASSFGRWLDRIFGDAVESGVGLASQELRYLEIQRAIRLSEKVQRKMNDAGVVDIRAVSPKIGLPILQNAAMEEDEKLHDLWSNLLAAALNPKGAKVERSFVSILKDFSSEDAATFHRIAIAWNEEKFVSLPHNLDTIRTENCVVSVVQSAEGPPFPEQMISVTNLARLGLIRPSNSTAKLHTIVPDKFHRSDPRIQEITVRVANDLNLVVLTPLGFEFWNAIR
ncbi:Abi-alpha family protein [Roseibium polysiphoniae]|uniref:DUF4393 domain-containing protein n=1 Tax=Roseibium polysiphoniae TaxID=2571221 RepID=A0ABR9CFD4_9HYPH|nr:Abi-alpha family protein [Roseibium polysiphoniae]MBD8878589.1 DUF4393 domain-containing protein [Roseibium polysiphoniae]